MVTSDYNLTEQIKAEHTRAELQRLDADMAGCGCSDCQALYKTLDLNKYANRVSDSGDTILIAEKSRQSSRVDDVSSSPESVCLRLPDKEDVVSKMLPDCRILPRIMKHRGRPRKQGKVSRVTQWRRNRGLATKDNTLLNNKGLSNGQ